MMRHHYSHHGHQKKPITFWGRFNLLFVLPIILILISAAVIGIHFHAFTKTVTPWGILFGATGATLLRLFIAYIFSVVVAVPLALWTQLNPRIEGVLLPIFDVLESVPILVFFPVIVIFFIHLQLLNIAAIFVIFVSMLWTILFNVVSGFKMIPQDIFSVAHVFKIQGWRRVFEILIPAIFPSIIVGSLLAWAGGWNIIIVAEVLQTYVPSDLSVHNLFGIGSTLVSASASGDKTLFLSAVIIIIAVIMLLNLLVWQRLLKYAERFKFE